MSVTITLKQTMARRTDAILHLVQHSLMIAGFVVVLGVISLFSHSSQSSASSSSQEETSTDFSMPAVFGAMPEDKPAAVALSPNMQAALNYVTRRYRVSPEALLPVFEAAQLVGRERRIDPLLIVAVIGVESGFNPFAESPMGAQGLMQVIPRFHQDKIPDGSGDKPFLNPEVNIRIGASVLEEAIRRRGSLVAGLQYYAGSSDLAGGYASKVLAEKERLEQAARRGNSADSSPSV